MTNKYCYYTSSRIRRYTLSCIRKMFVVIIVREYIITTNISHYIRRCIITIFIYYYIIECILTTNIP